MDTLQLRLSQQQTDDLLAALSMSKRETTDLDQWERWQVLTAWLAYRRRRKWGGQIPTRRPRAPRRAG